MIQSGLEPSASVLFVLKCVTACKGYGALGFSCFISVTQKHKG